jgi:hypothetical protein
MSVSLMGWLITSKVGAELLRTAMSVAVVVEERAEDGSGEKAAVLVVAVVLVSWQCCGVVGGVVSEEEEEGFEAEMMVVGMGIEWELAGEVEGGVW